jgi:LmbE family N-acetylglucosaminyl deacetylase
MLHHPDGGVMDVAALRKDLFRCVRKYKPDRVISMDPWTRYEIHPDHWVVGRMGAEAAVFAGFPLLYPEQFKDGIQPHFASEVWFMGMLGNTPNCYVDVSSTIDKKVEAILQFETTMSIITDLFAMEINTKNRKRDEKELVASTEKWIRTRAEQTGKKAGLKAAEAFYIQQCRPGHFHNLHLDPVEYTGKQDNSTVIY